GRRTRAERHRPAGVIERRYLRFWRSDPRADVDDELRFHLEMRARDLIAEGVPAHLARAEAASSFGDIGAIRNECITIDERRQRRAERSELMSDAWFDLRFAVRSLRK